MSTIPVEGLRGLKIGDRVEYRSGRGETRIEALTEVAHKHGTWSIALRILTIRKKGSRNKKVEGDELVARAGEVFTLQYPSEEPSLIQKIATNLHSRLCQDVYCNWETTTWAQPGKARRRYLKMAEETVKNAEGDISSV